MKKKTLNSYWNQPLRAWLLLPMGILLLGSPILADNNGPWTPDRSRSADKNKSGWYPSTNNIPPAPAKPAKPAKAAPPADSDPAPRKPMPNHYDNNGPWSPDQSRTADNPYSINNPKSPRGFYPPMDGSPDKPDTSIGNALEKLPTSKLANPLIQGGKAIGRTWEAADRGDNKTAQVEAVDGVGRLLSIGAGAKEGALLGTAIAGPIGGIIGGGVGGWLGNKAWNATGGAINDKSRKLIEQQRAQARMQALQGRQSARPPRPSSGSRGACRGACPR